MPHQPLQSFVEANFHGKTYCHATSPEDFKAILTDGFLRPRARTDTRWADGGSACQCLGAVSLFDFSKWAFDEWTEHMILPHVVAREVNVAIEIEAVGEIKEYPATKDLTAKFKECHGPIPHVEVCHVGSIPVSSFKCYWLIDRNGWRTEKHEDRSVKYFSRILAEFLLTPATKPAVAGGLSPEILAELSVLAEKRDVGTESQTSARS